MAVNTMTVDLDVTPIDLAAVAEIAAALAMAGQLELTVQNVSQNKNVILAERPAAPADGSRDGHVLGYRDAAVVSLERGGVPLWVWSTTTAIVAVTAAA